MGRITSRNEEERQEEEWSSRHAWLTRKLKKRTNHVHCVFDLEFVISLNYVFLVKLMSAFKEGQIRQTVRMIMNNK